MLLFASLLINVILIANARRTSDCKREHSGNREPSLAEITAERESEESYTQTVDPSDVPSDDADPDIAAELNSLRERVSEFQGELATERKRKRSQSEHQEKKNVALAPAMETKLGTIIEANIRNRNLYELLEILRAECRLEFIYDPVIQPRLESVRIDLSMGRVPARKVLDFIAEVSKIEIQYFNQWVWIKTPSQANPK